MKLFNIINAIIVILVKIKEILRHNNHNNGIPLSELAEEIANFEGWNIENSICRKNNNPGNLRFSRYQLRIDNGFAYFANSKIGWKALLYDLKCKCTGQTRTNLNKNSTIKELINVWSPLQDNNNTENYLKYVCEKLNIPLTYQLKNFIL